MNRPGNNALMLPLLAALAMASGCSRSMVREPLNIDGPTTDAAGAQLDFWHSLPGKSAISNNEGLHGLILFVDGNDPHENYDQRVAYAKEKGWLTQGFDEPGDMVMQRGTLARAIAVSSDIKGGVMMRVTNSSGRYASRELQYLGIMAESTEQQALSGLDFVGVISKMQDYQAIEAARVETGRPRSQIRAVPPREKNNEGVGTGTETSTGTPPAADAPGPQ
jgi:hypothetical protein